MLASQRKQQILQILTEEKQVMSGELSQRFNVSEDSIRRDLRELAAEGNCSGPWTGIAGDPRHAPLTRKVVQDAYK
ncbi:DeoR family transcriptional regulator, partial [Klebsiella pneumoniae]